MSGSQRRWRSSGCVATRAPALRATCLLVVVFKNSGNKLAKRQSSDWKPDLLLLQRGLDTSDLALGQGQQSLEAPKINEQEKNI